MLIYISMMLWVLLMRAACAPGMKVGVLYNGVPYYTVGKLVAALTMGYIVFWVGMRTAFVDTAAYISGFRAASTDFSRIPALLVSNVKGQGWAAMEIIFKGIVSDNPQAWLMFHSILMGTAVAGCYRRYSEAFFFSMLLFLLSGSFTWMMNGIRQFFCVAVLMMATPWLLKGKMLHYMLLIAALSLVHFTAWLMVPIYFVVRQKPWGKMTLLAIMATVAVCAMAAPFAEVVEESLESTSYAGSTVFLEDDDGAHPLRIVVACIPAVLGLVMRKRIQAENNMLLNIGINMSVLAALLFTFAVFTSGILMGRLPVYCEIYAPITLTLLINRLASPGIRKLVTLACVTGYVFFFYFVYGVAYYVSNITGFMPRNPF